MSVKPCSSTAPGLTCSRSLRRIREQPGWLGLMVLTNMLPAQGNGSYTFYMWAQDVEGGVALLGSRTLTCDNAHATLPFGTIDTPGQGETVSGSSYVNFGWALTQNPKYIPTDYPALEVYIDGSPIGAPAYGYYRSDIATFFPGLPTATTRWAYKILDTTALSNGLHTIVWTATDSGGFIEGLGSRYFTVSNGYRGHEPRRIALRCRQLGRRDDRCAAACPAGCDRYHRPPWLGRGRAVADLPGGCFGHGDRPGPGARPVRVAARARGR